MLVRLGLCFGLLVYASFLDWRFREIDDKSWVLMVVLGALFLIYDFVRTGGVSLILGFFVSVGVATIFAVTLSYLNIMGGGDGRILIGVAALVPSLSYPTMTVFPIFILSVYFGNAVLLAALFPLIFFILNLGHLKEVKSYKGFLALFLGYEKDAADVGEFEAFLGRDGHFELMTKKDALGERIKGEGRVWVTPAIPFVVLITVGFVISVVYGDILSLLMLRFF